MCLIKFEGGEMLHEMFSYVKKSVRLWKAKTYQSWKVLLLNRVSEQGMPCRDGWSRSSTSLGFNVLRIINKPTIPAIAYGIDKKLFLLNLDVLRIINEPTATAIAYGVDEKCLVLLAPSSSILAEDPPLCSWRLRRVFWGQGHRRWYPFKVYLFWCEELIFEVKATAGDIHLRTCGRVSVTLLFLLSFTNDFGPAALLFPQALYICFVLHALEYTLS